MSDLQRLRQQARDGFDLRIDYEMRKQSIPFEEAKFFVKGWLAEQLKIKRRKVYWERWDDNRCVEIIKLCGTYCIHCGNPASLTTEDKIPRLKSNDPNKFFWICEPCGAWCGTHKNTVAPAPLGLPANEKLRKLRQQAHFNLDPLWKRKMKRDNCSKGQARRAGYKWLAEQLGISFGQCHIALFNEKQCMEVLRLCSPIREAILQRA